MTFEEKMKRLSEITERIEERSCGLDESIALYEEGLKLSKELQELLDGYSKKIEEISKGDTSNE